MSDLGEIQGSLDLFTSFLPSFHPPLFLPFFLSLLFLPFLLSLFYENIQVNFFETLRFKCIKPFYFSFVGLDITVSSIHLFIQQILNTYCIPGLELDLRLKRQVGNDPCFQVAYIYWALCVVDPLFWKIQYTPRTYHQKYLVTTHHYACSIKRSQYITKKSNSIFPFSYI